MKVHDPAAIRIVERHNVHVLYSRVFFPADMPKPIMGTLLNFLLQIVSSYRWPEEQIDHEICTAVGDFDLVGNAR